MARGALVRLQARDGYHTSDNEPSLACHASASITGCVRKSLSRLRPSACLTRDHRLGLAQRPKPDCRYTPLFGCEAKLAVERRSEAGEPTVAREQVCGPSVILTTSVNGAREISAGRSPLAKQVARAVRARQNHAGGVPANCGSVSPERSEPRSGRYAGCEQVGRRPRFRPPPFEYAIL